MIGYISLTPYGDTYQVRYFKTTVAKEILIPKVPQELMEIITSLVEHLESYPLPEEKIIELTQAVEQAAVEKDIIQAKANRYKDFLLQSELRPEQMLELIDIYPDWEKGISYSGGAVLKHSNTLYEVLAPGHTSQADWTPDKTPALFKKVVPVGVIPEWIQPTGGHDAYTLGAKVVCEEKVYESLIAANVWKPVGNPSLWKEIV